MLDWLAVVGELQRDWNVLRFAQRLHDRLQRVLVLARDAQLVALDADLHLGRYILDALAKIARDVIRDPCVEPDLDLPASFAHRLRVAGLEELRRQLPPGALLTQHLEGRLRTVFARRLDDDEIVAALLVRRLRVLEIEARADLAARLVQRVGELGSVELRDDVEGVLSHLTRRSSGGRR